LSKIKILHPQKTSILSPSAMDSIARSGEVKEQYHKERWH